MELSWVAAQFPQLSCLEPLAQGESTGAHLHLDHLTPKSAGGADVATNLVLACRSCNSARKDMPLAKWCASLGMSSRTVRAQARRALPVAV